MDLTGYENKDFAEVAGLINQTVDEPVRYVTVNPLLFYRIKSKEGISKAPLISSHDEDLTTKRPTTLQVFIQRERHHFKIPDDGRPFLGMEMF